VILVDDWPMTAGAWMSTCVGAILWILRDLEMPEWKYAGTIIDTGSSCFI
jgi:hypothetical protein